MVEIDEKEPPTSAEELKKRYKAGERCFREANLREADLGGADLRGATFSDADLNGADLSGATLDKAILRDAELRGAKLNGADLSCALIGGVYLIGTRFGRANPQKTIFERANRNGTRLKRADLSGAVLNGADLGGANVTLSNIDAATSEKSKWSNDYVLKLINRGAKPSDDLIEKLREGETAEGLTLYFDQRLSRVDRFVVEGVIIGILGRDTDCEVTLFEQRENTPIVRLEASYPDDLERVANALWDRVWENTTSPHGGVALAIRDNFAEKMLDAISLMRDKLDRIELREGSDKENETYEIIRKWNKLIESKIPELQATFDILKSEQDKTLLKEMKETPEKKVVKAIASEIIKTAVGSILPSGKK